VFKIEGVFRNSPTSGITVHTSYDQSLWYLAQKHVVLYVIHVAVEIHFAEALTATINVIMYAEFDIIEIDRNRQVFV
jgi:hypothetical protein